MKWAPDVWKAQLVMGKTFAQGILDRKRRWESLFSS